MPALGARAGVAGITIARRLRGLGRRLSELHDVWRRVTVYHEGGRGIRAQHLFWRYNLKKTPFTSFLPLLPVVLAP